MEEQPLDIVRDYLGDHYEEIMERTSKGEDFWEITKEISKREKKSKLKRFWDWVM